MIVVPAEASTRNKKISTQSPMGAALMGKRVGDRISVRIRAPKGSTLQQVESTPATKVVEHEPAQKS